MRLLALALLLTASTAAAQTVAGDRLTLNTGPCTVHSESGAPASGFGAVCDVYVRTDSPYTVYVKTGASTWTAVVQMPSSAAAGDLLAASSATVSDRIAAVAAGQVLASNGTGALPAYTANPSVTSVTTTGAVGVLSQGTTPRVAWYETDGTADARRFQARVNADTWSLQQTNDSTSVVTSLLTLAHGGNMTVQPVGDVIFDPTGNDLLPTTGYDLNLGSLAKKYLTLHAAELWVETLVAQNTIATIGGRVLVGPTTTLTADLSDVATSIQVKHNQIANGDRLYLEADGKVEFLAVTSGASGSAGAYTYTVTRNLDGSGANTWYAGDAVLNTGTTGDGYIDLYSVSGVNAGSTVGPTIVGNVRTGTTYSNLEPRWAIGNLNGVYGYSADTYGAAFGDNSNAWVKIDPTNGVRIGENTTTYFQVDPSGTATFAGAITAASGTIGGWTIGANLLSAGSGSTTVGISSASTGGDDIRFYAGNGTASSAPFRVTEAGALTASNATITGTVTAASGAIGGWYLNSGYLCSDDGCDSSYASGMAAVATGTGTNASDVVYWAGNTYTNRNSAPFRVYAFGGVALQDVITSPRPSSDGYVDLGTSSSGWGTTYTYDLVLKEDLNWQSGVCTTSEAACASGFVGTIDIYYQGTKYRIKAYAVP